MNAALLGTNTSFVLLAFLPPILWLLFYLHEDRRPEPKHLIFLAFVGGMAAAIVALFAECTFAFLSQGTCSGDVSLTTFFAIALIEEIAKYLPVRFLIINRPEFDEPIDAMIYMMTAALGFAALENALFLFSSGYFYAFVERTAAVLPFAAERTFAVIPLTRATLASGLELSTRRFVGANLLHALSSGIVGYFLARAYFSKIRHHIVAGGILLAALLHTGFNYLILKGEAGAGFQWTFYLILLLSIMAVMVFVEFERLKKSSPTSPDIPPSPPTGGGV